MSGRGVTHGCLIPIIEVSTRGSLCRDWKRVRGYKLDRLAMVREFSALSSMDA